MIELRERETNLIDCETLVRPVRRELSPVYRRRRGALFGSFSLLLVPVLFSLLLPANILRAATTDNTLLILDASGSMWGRVEGRTKIETARDVIVELLDSSSSRKNLGLMSYGHRRKGDCSDIELLVTPAQNTNDAIQSAVKSIRPHGKTPLSASVIEAARTLRNTYEKATVILISDGRETCGYDPCQVAMELEQAGIDFTAHVIGFNVTDPIDLSQLQCMADNTGGQFVAVDNGAELSLALQSVSNVFEPVEDRMAGSEAGLTGSEAGVGSRIDSNGDFVSSNGNSIPGTDEDTEIFIEPLARQSTVRPLPEILTRREATDNASGGKRKSYADADSISHGNNEESNGTGGTAEQPIAERATGPDIGGVTELPASSVAVVVPVGLSVPPVVYTSQVFTARWSGTGSAGDRVAIAVPDSTADRWTRVVTVGSGKKVKLTAPDQAGEYEVRYVSADMQVIAQAVITVLKAEATLVAPAQARSGRLVRIRWKGGTKDPKDSIVITRRDAPMSSAINRRVIRTETSVMLLMPSRPGEYELRYMQAGGNAIASQSILVR